MVQEDLITAVTARLSAAPHLSALLLGGSFGRGDADEYSDVDLIALVAPDGHDDFAKLWREALGAILPVVYWAERRGGGRILMNAVAEGFLRCDMYIVAPGDLTGRAQDCLRPLIDRDGVMDRLPATLPPRRPDPAAVLRIANEFIRVLGLLPVVARRGEPVTAAQGAGLLRDLLIQLMLEETTTPDPGGALHLSRVLPAEDMATLAALPAAPPHGDPTHAAHVATAAAFLPRAKALAARCGADWPAAFEAEARAQLEARLSLKIGA